MVILTETTLLLLTGLYLHPPNPLFAEPISGRSTNSVDLTAVNSFPLSWCHIEQEALL